MPDGFDFLGVVLFGSLQRYGCHCTNPCAPGTMGRPAWDIRNNLVANYLWSLPKGSRLWGNFLTRAVLDNWQISGIASYVSGAPGGIILKTSNSANITGGGDGARVDLSGDPMQGAPRTFNHWFNTGVVSVPVAGAIATATKPAVMGQDPAMRRR